MDQAINHKIHYISRQQRQEILAIARGEAVADYLIENVVILDLINGGEIAGPIAIKGRYIAGIVPNIMTRRHYKELMLTEQ